MNFQRKPIYLKAVEEVEEIIISGQDAFVLWDTYGFPLDFTQLMAEERALNFKVDVDGFNKALDQARKRSRSSRSTALNQQVGLHKTSDVYVTDDSYKYVWFEDHETSILGIYPGSILGIAPIGNEFGIHLQSTSFYAEQGGQKVLGPHTYQKRSIVKHVKPVDDELLREIETIVNDQITAGLNVYAKEVSLVEALRVNGLQTLEGEVYPDPVSVVAIGHEVEHLVANPDNDKWLSISSQLCGGTHVTNTSEIKAFVIISERESANGIRRITALTGDDAISVLKFKRSIVQELNEASEQDRSVLEELVSIMVFSIDDTKNYSMVCAALLNSDPSTLEGWLKSALVPLKPRGKNSTWLEFYTCCFAIGRGNDASKLDEAMEMASKFAELKLKWMPSC
ncbi:Alanine--tRNA ligase [Linum perenne]